MDKSENTREFLYEFANFRLLPGESQLLRDDQPVELPPKVFDTLLILVERAGHLVEKDKLLDKIWADTFVEEATLTRNISLLRKVLGSDKQKFIETVPKRGYRFIEPVRRLSVWEEKNESAIGNLSEGKSRDPLLLTEFTNLTGDAVFDGTLKTALAVTLEQSPFLQIFSDARTRQILRLMQRSPDERVTPKIGREICLRQGLKAYVAGTITGFGKSYAITLEAVNARTGETIGRQLAQADSKEQVLKALGRAASGLRENLGESVRSIEKFDAPLELTTSSLNALKIFTAGQEQKFRGKMLEAVPFYRRAIELDPHFAYAYAALATIYNNAGQPKSAADCASKAFALRERASELEKFRIAFYYYTFVPGDIEKAIETLALYKHTYPRDARAFNNLADNYMRIGRFEKAIDCAREALRFEPHTYAIHWNLAESLLRLNRFAEAKEVCRRAFEQNLDGGYFHIGLYQIAFIEDDAQMMAEHLAWFDGQPDDYVALELQAASAGFRGEWQKAQDFSRRAQESAIRRSAGEVAAQYAAEQALRIAFSHFGAANDIQQRSAVQMQTQESLALGRSKITLTRCALALAVAGKTAEAGELAEELKTEYPKDTLVNNLWLPLVRAALALQNDKAIEAIELLETAERFEPAAEFYPQYLRGRAYLKLNQAERAIAEFEKILNHRGEAPLSLLYPLAQSELFKFGFTVQNRLS